MALGHRMRQFRCMQEDRHPREEAYTSVTDSTAPCAAYLSLFRIGAGAES